MRLSKNSPPALSVIVLSEAPAAPATCGLRLAVMRVLEREELWSRLGRGVCRAIEQMNMRADS